MDADRRQADVGCGKERSGSRGGMTGPEGVVEGPGDFNRSLYASGKDQQRFCEMFNEASRHSLTRRVV